MHSTRVLLSPVVSLIRLYFVSRPLSLSICLYYWTYFMWNQIEAITMNDLSHNTRPTITIGHWRFASKIKQSDRFQLSKFMHQIGWWLNFFELIEFPNSWMWQTVMCCYVHCTTYVLPIRFKEVSTALNLVQLYLHFCNVEQGFVWHNNVAVKCILFDSIKIFSPPWNDDTFCAVTQVHFNDAHGKLYHEYAFFFSSKWRKNYTLKEIVNRLYTLRFYAHIL